MEPLSNFERAALIQASLVKLQCDAEMLAQADGDAQSADLIRRLDAALKSVEQYRRMIDDARVGGAAIVETDGAGATRERRGEGADPELAFLAHRVGRVTRSEALRFYRLTAEEQLIELSRLHTDDVAQFLSRRAVALPFDMQEEAINRAVALARYFP